MGAYGIDVSDFQGNVNWEAVAADGISFAFLKATEGTSFVSDSFATNWARSKAAGVIRGAYHFFRPQSDPQAQAEHFLRIVKLESGDLPPVLDIESTAGMSGEAIASRMAKWLEIVEKATGRKSIIYTYPGFWQRIGNLQRFRDYPLWIAHYTSDDDPWLPGGWDTWTIWQYTDSGQVSGIDGGVDVNRFQSSLEGKANSKVMGIQKCLKNKGFYPGNPDGVFGASTKSAVVSFQTAMNLEADGIVGIQTWTALIDPFIKPNPPQSDPLPQLEPPLQLQPQPPNPGKLSAIRLTEICKSYQGLIHQDDALDGLQEQIPLATMIEFSKKWRNTTSSASIRLINVCKSYQNKSHQDRALQWLQEQIPQDMVERFAQQWHSQSVSQSTAIRLINVCKSYQGKTHQEQALSWLQRKISQATLQEFAPRWRNSTSKLPILLINVCRSYQGKAHQDRALEWLQRQIPLDILEEFARQWRN